MLTLSDINTVTNSHVGSIYSDLHKDVYGSRPRGTTFESLEEFNEDFDFLAKCLEGQLAKERVQQARNFDAFVKRVEETMKIVAGTTLERAVEIIADAESISKDQFDFYGLEILENELNLKYGSIIKWLSE